MSLQNIPKPHTHMVFELWDIFDTIKFRSGKSNVCEILRENIIYILKREGLWNDQFTVIFPHGALKELDLSGSTYQYDYSIYSETKEDYIAHGTIFGSGIVEILSVSKHAPMPYINADFEINDMTLEVCEGKDNLLKMNAPEVIVFS